MGLDAPTEIILFLGYYASKTSPWLLQKGMAMIIVIDFFFLRYVVLHPRCCGKHLVSLPERDLHGGSLDLVLPQSCT